MKGSFALILATICTAAIVSAQNNPTPSPQQPGAQQPSTQQPSTPPPSTQSPATPAGQKPSSSAQANPMGQVTYTGCLKPGTAADTWTLENAEVAAAGAKSETQTPVGTSATTQGKGTVISLSAKPTENLKPHANHKIQVVGTLSPAGAGAAGAKPSAGAAPSASSSTPQQTLTVESFKMVSATCP